MTTQQSLYYHLKKLDEAIGQNALDLMEMVPKRHFNNLEGCIKRCIDIIETLANKLPLEEKELRDDARIYLNILNGLIHGRTIKPYVTPDEQRKANVQKQKAEAKLSRPERLRGKKLKGKK